MSTPAQLRRRRRRSEGLADFSAFYREHAQRVLIYLARRCVDPEVAVDLMAETFAEALASRLKYRGTSDAQAAAWVFGIARHKLVDYFRSGSAEQRAVQRLGLLVPPLGDDDRARIEELADLGPMRQAVTEQFELLSAEQREAVRLRVVDEMSYAEVAGHLRISEETARARVSRGLRRLGASLDQLSPTQGGPGK